MRVAPVAAPRPHELVVEAPLRDQLALFHLETRRLHLLNGSAAAIWSQLHEADTIGDVTIGIGDRFDVDPLSIRRDVERTIEQLRADGLLRVDNHFVPACAQRPGFTLPDRPVAAPVRGSYRALNADIGLICDDDEITDAIAGVLAPLRSDRCPNVAIEIDTDSEAGWLVAVGGADPVRLGSRLSVVLRAVGEVNNLAVASVPNDLVLHAGAVSADGRAVVMPAASNHGKSTLTTALVAAGYSYLTDEAAAIEDDLQVRAFPKSIALDPGSFPLFSHLAPAEAADALSRAIACREWHVDPKLVGTTAPSATVAAIVCPHWRAGTTTRVSPVDPTEALHLLLGEAFDFATAGQTVFDRLVRMVRDVPVFRIGYSDLNEAVIAVGEILADA
jgi:hypothetical protein